MLEENYLLSKKKKNYLWVLKYMCILTQKIGISKFKIEPENKKEIYKQ